VAVPKLALATGTLHLFHGMVGDSCSFLFCRPGSKDHWDLDAQVYAEWGEQLVLTIFFLSCFVQVISPTK
jgi:hypothetical protein